MNFRKDFFPQLGSVAVYLLLPSLYLLVFLPIFLPFCFLFFLFPPKKCFIIRAGRGNCPRPPGHALFVCKATFLLKTRKYSKYIGIKLEPLNTCKSNAFVHSHTFIGPFFHICYKTSIFLNPIVILY